MTDTKHPITPPSELVRKWRQEAPTYRDCGVGRERWLIDRAAQWGADQELLACGNYLKQCAQWEEEDVTEFYNYRRPKPPSLKEQALNLLTQIVVDLDRANMRDQASTLEGPIRRALEQLND